MNMIPTSVTAATEQVTAPSGVRVSFKRTGSGPPLVLVHGGFSDHVSNWMYVLPLLRDSFTLYAIARRGRGETDATHGHSVEDEARDVAAVIREIEEPVFLLGHSYGGLVALAAARMVPDRVRRLVLYEAPWPMAFRQELLTRMELFAKDRQWDRVAETFFVDGLSVPQVEVDAVRASSDWPPIVRDAPASLGDLRALLRYRFDPESCRALTMPVLLQIGSESPHALFLTEALATVLPNARVKVLRGQAHEGMTTAPEMYAAAVTAFLRR
jgi:pimeloyl-ACP methyl ester carboxylesterase